MKPCSYLPFQLHIQVSLEKWNQPCYYPAIAVENLTTTPRRKYNGQVIDYLMKFHSSKNGTELTLMCLNVMQNKHIEKGSYF